VNVIATARRRSVARTVVFLGAILVSIAIAAILCHRGERPESLAADGERHAAADRAAAVEAASLPAPTPTPTIAREAVAPAATGGSRTVLRGTVRLAGIGAPVRRGALFAEYVDCVAAGVAPETLVGRDPEQLNEHRADRRAQLTANGDYELELPGPILLIRIVIEPPKGAELAGSRESVCFGGFELLEVPIGEAITAVWQRDFEVSAGGRLVGFTVEAGSGAPVPGALVRTAFAYMFDQQGAHSDARGAFAITGLPAEPTFPDAKLKVRVSCTGFLDRELLVQPAVNGPTEVLVELERAVIVSGRVVDPEGHGVSHATVDAVAFAGGPTPFGQPLALVQSMQTVDDGSFTFSLPPVARLCLRAEGSYRVSAESEQWTSGVGRLALESLRDRGELRLELRSQTSLRVRATLPDGSVVPQGDVVVLVEDDEGWRRFGAFFTASAAVEHTIHVLAPPPGTRGMLLGRHVNGLGQPQEDRRAFRGSATCMSTRTDGKCTEIAVALEPWQPEVPPALPPETSGEKVMFAGADAPGEHACFFRDLTFLDDATGEPLANRGYSVSIGLSGIGGQTSSRGRVRLAVGAGTVDMTVRVDGCQPQSFRIANPATGYAAIDVRLRPTTAERR